MINQAGRAVPVFLMVMAVYLFISLTTSILMNIYNRRVQIVER
jgi:general L-amino acid transport system permease protein